MEDGDYELAFQYLTKTTELGNVPSNFELGCMYHRGNGVEKDESKAVYHWKKAAIAGHTQARHNLGGIEAANGRAERVWLGYIEASIIQLGEGQTLTNWIIAAKLGEDQSLESLKQFYRLGLGNVSKEDFTSALRGHRDAVDAMKSPSRTRASNCIVFLNGL